MSKDNQQKIIGIIKSISGQANVLTIPRLYINILKSHRAALFLSQCVYWSTRGGEDGWFYKSFREWQEELGLNQHAVETCVKLLKENKLLETELRKAGRPESVTFYRANIENLVSVLSETAIAETAKTSKRKTIRPTIRHRLQQRESANAVGETVQFNGIGYDNYTE